MVIETINIIEEYLNKIKSYNIDVISDGLTEGKLGLIIYYLSLYEHDKNEEHLESIGCLLEAIFRNLEENNEDNLFLKSSLSSGLTGLSYILNILIEENILDGEYHTQIEKINPIVFETTQKLITENNFDYLNGSIGNLWYFFKLKEQNYLFSLIDTLYAKSISDEHLFYTQSDNHYVNGMNFGLAHGYLGFLKILISISEDYGASDKIEKLISKLIDKIIRNLDFEYTINDINIYKPYKISLEENVLKKHQNNRLAWCNSDLTFSYLLYKVGFLHKNKEYLKLAETISLETIKRKEFSITGIENDHFCHGSSGVALLYKEIYKLTKNELFNDAYQYWKDKTLTYLNENKENNFEKRDMSLLYGRIGALMVIDDNVNTDKYLEILI